MQEHMPTYDEALSILKEFTKSESLLKHAYSVEGWKSGVESRADQIGLALR